MSRAAKKPDWDEAAMITFRSDAELDELMGAFVKALGGFRSREKSLVLRRLMKAGIKAELAKKAEAARA